MNVVPIMPKRLQEDPVAMLRALANDLESGHTPMYDKAALITMDANGSLRLWSFGVGVKSRLETLGLLQAGAALQYEVVVGEQACS